MTPPSLHCNNAETTTSTHLALNEQGPKVTLYHVVHGTSWTTGMGKEKLIFLRQGG